VVCGGYLAADEYESYHIERFYSGDPAIDIRVVLLSRHVTAHDSRFPVNYTYFRPHTMPL
jgi:hypothetical protein